MADDGVHSLQAEVLQLQSALKEALQEKYEAAQYGLRLLEEKQHLQNLSEELEKRLEETNRELKLSKQKLDEQNLIQRRLSMAGFEEEQDMLSKYANKETQLVSQVQDLEVELKEVKIALERQMTDNDSLHQKLTDQLLRCEDLEKNNQSLKAELKESKVKEGQLLNEFDDLESENLDLQKTILALKTSQVEFESLRHEFKRLQEENEIIHSQLEEITRLKRMTEKSLEEALESLQIERDQRHNLRKELDSRLTSESIYHFTTLHSDLKGAVNLSLTNRDTVPSAIQSIDKTEAALVEHVDTEEKATHDNAHVPHSTNKETNGNPNHVSPDDLFTELRTTEVAKYQLELAQLEAEKNELNRVLEETQRSLELANSETANKQERINGLLAQLDAIMSVRSEADEEFVRKDAENESSLDVVPGGFTTNDMTESSISVLLHLDENDGGENSIRNKAAYKQLRKALRLVENRYCVALRQIASMQHDLWRYHEREKLNSRPELATEEGLKQELIELQTSLEQRCDEIKSLKNKLDSNQEASRLTEDKLNTYSKDIARTLRILLETYTFVCSTMKEGPAKQVTELADRLHIPLRLNNSDSPDVSVASDLTTNDEGDILMLHLAPKNSPTSEVLGNAVDFQLTMANHLRHSMFALGEKYAQVSKQATGQINMDLEEAQQEILRLKASNKTKRDQLVTLRSVIQQNKTTAESALAHLKQKYEKEKLMVSETIKDLRSELAALKESAATQTSVHAVFIQRYNDCMAQMDEIQCKLNAAEEEKMTVSALLRLAICQKLELTQRLEAYECEREIMNAQQPRSSVVCALTQPHHSGYRPNLMPNSLLPSPLHPQGCAGSLFTQHHPVSAHQTFNAPDSSLAARMSNGGAPSLPTFPVHQTILSPQHANPNLHTGAKPVPTGPNRLKRTPRAKRDGQ